ESIPLFHRQLYDEVSANFSRDKDRVEPQKSPINQPVMAMKKVVNTIAPRPFMFVPKKSHNRGRVERAINIQAIVFLITGIQ
ncbi:MAG: hypothetical protein AAF236_17110, partial [Verrucomicrobiota bacterium]